MVNKARPDTNKTQQVAIERELMKRLRIHCANKDLRIKDFIEAALIKAMR